MGRKGFCGVHTWEKNGHSMEGSFHETLHGSPCEPWTMEGSVEEPFIGKLQSNLGAALIWTKATSKAPHTVHGVHLGSEGFLERGLWKNLQGNSRQVGTTPKGPSIWCTTTNVVHHKPWCAPWWDPQAKNLYNKFLSKVRVSWGRILTSFPPWNIYPRMSLSMAWKTINEHKTSQH